MDNSKIESDADMKVCINWRLKKSICTPNIWIPNLSCILCVTIYQFTSDHDPTVVK